MRATSILMAAILCGAPAWAQGQASEPESRPKIREQSIYIPYDKLQETFEKEGRGVFVPYERFQELWQAARASQFTTPPAGPPVKAMITEIDSLASVEKDVVRVEATLKIDLLTSGWLTIPLRLADAAVLSASVGEEPARLIPHDGGQALLLKHDTDVPRQISLKLVYAKAYEKAPGNNSVSFQAPLAPVNRWRIRIPEPGIKVNVRPMLAATEVPSRDVANPSEGEEPRTDDVLPADEGETVLMAFVGAAPAVEIDWTPKTQGATGLDALVGVQSRQQITIDEGITRTRATLDYEVSRAELSTLTIEVPADQKVVNVLDANVRGWNVSVDGPVQRITVDLFQPARDKQALVVELEKFRDDQAVTEVSAAVVKAVGVGRQRGIVVVQVAPELRAEAVRRTALSQMDLQELPDELKAAAVAVAYRYASLPFELDVRVEKIQPRITVKQVAEAFLEPRMITYALVAKYEIQRAGVFQLECRIPPNFEVRDVTGQACADAQAATVESFAIDPEDVTKLSINLGSKAMGSIGLLVQLSRELDDPNLLTPTNESSVLEFVPPRVEGANIVRSTGSLVICAPESLRVVGTELIGMRAISFDQAFAAIQPLFSERFQQLRPTLIYEFAGDTVSAKVDAQRRQPLVNARQLLVARIDPGVIKYEATFYYDVRYSGIESLRVDVPQELVGKLRNDTRGLRDVPITPAPADVAEGYTALSFTGDAELLGQQQLKLVWEQPLEEFGVGKSVNLRVPRLIPSGVARADGQVVLAKAETIDVRPTDQTQGLDAIDPQLDLMQGAQVPDAAMALEFRDGEWNLELTATRYQLEILKHTSIEQAVLRLVITRNDRIAVQALYRLRSNMQRLRLELPFDVAAGAIEFDTEPLRINGRAVTLERGQDPRTFFVPLVGYTTNDPLLLELRYTMPGSEEDLRYPAFPDDPAMQRVNLVAYIPRERDLIGSRGPWSADMEWTIGDLLERRYVPSQDVNKLVADLQAGIDVLGNPAADFPVDGKPLLFTTLRPRDPDDGSLQLTTINRKIFDAIVLVGFLTLGVSLLSQTYVRRMVCCSALLGAFLLIGVFMPLLAGHVVDQTLIVAVVLVALLWLSISMLRVVPRLARMSWRPAIATVSPLVTAGGATVSEAVAVAVAKSPPEHPPSEQQDAEGGEHHA